MSKRWQPPAPTRLVCGAAIPLISVCTALIVLASAVSIAAPSKLSVEVHPGVATAVDRLAVADGTHVSEGDVLLDLDPEPINQRLEAAENRLRKLLQDTYCGRLDCPAPDTPKVRQALNDIDRHRLHLSLTRIRAPISGTVRWLVQEGAIVAPDRPVVTITRRSRQHSIKGFTHASHLHEETR